SPADVETGIVGSVAVTLPTDILGLTTATVEAELAIASTAQAAGTPDTIIFNGPYPQTETFEAGATPAADLATDLLGNLTIETTLSAELGGLGIVLDTILGLLGVNLNSLINDTLMPLVESLVSDASGLLNPI